MTSWDDVLQNSILGGEDLRQLCGRPTSTCWEDQQAVTSHHPAEHHPDTIRCWSQAEPKDQLIPRHLEHEKEVLICLWFSGWPDLQNTNEKAKEKDKEGSFYDKKRRRIMPGSRYLQRTKVHGHVSCTSQNVKEHGLQDCNDQGPDPKAV